MGKSRAAPRRDPVEESDSISSDEQPEKQTKSNSHRRCLVEMRSLESPAPKRQRVSRACDQCRGRKDKCDGKQPVCSTCESTSQQCSYGAAPKRRGLPSGYVRGLEVLLSLIFSRIQSSEDTVLALLSDTFENQDKNMSKDELETLLQVWRKGPVMNNIERFIPRIEAIEEVRPRRPIERDETEALGTLIPYDICGDTKYFTVFNGVEGSFVSSLEVLLWSLHM
jgi:hypothetical protein